MITTRGKQVRAVFIALLIGLTIYLLNSWSTPNICKKPTAQLSQGCLDILYPH